MKRNLMLAIGLVSIIFTSCDTDFNSVGADILGGASFEFTGGNQYGVKAYNQVLGPIATHKLPVNQLGVYKDDVFGVTRANFVTQLQMANPNPTLGANVAVDSVVLELPYVSEIASTDVNGWSKYNLKDIYVTTSTNEDTKHLYQKKDVAVSVFPSMNLEVYRNGVQLNDYDPDTDFATLKKYYSNENNLFDNSKIGSKLNDADDVKQNTEFRPQFIQIVKKKPKSKVSGNLTTYEPGTEVVSREAPMMRLRLNNTFANDILNAPSDKLLNNNAFVNYYKGLYFKVTGEQGTLSKLDFKKGKVIIYYQEDKIESGVNKRPLKTFVLNMSGVSVNLLDNSSNTLIIPAPDKVNGDPLLYLKGGEGSMAVLSLFNPGEIETLKSNKAIINDASLYFTVHNDQSLKRPLRLYLYDIDNDKVIADYSLDQTTNTSNNLLDKYVFGGILADVKLDNISQKRYRIRITNHISNIINTVQNQGVQYKNVRLGLLITDNINTSDFSSLKDPKEVPADATNALKNIKIVPKSSLLSPMGLKLYGTGSGVNDIKFRINYSKPN